MRSGNEYSFRGYERLDYFLLILGLPSECVAQFNQRPTMYKNGIKKPLIWTIPVPVMVILDALELSLA
jgi:hypothetical protein